MNCLDNLNKCDAMCCKVITIELRNPTIDLLRYYKFHNCEVFRKSRTDYTVVVPLECNKLVDNKCSIQDTKPAVCRNFNENNSKGYLYLKIV